MNDDPDSAEPPAGRRDDAPVSRDEFAALGTVVARIQAHLDQVHAGHSALASTVSEQLAPTVADLMQRVDDIDSQLRQILETLRQILETHDDERRSGSVDWLELTAEQAAREWELLAAWIAKVVPWAEITRAQLPDCWPLHPRAHVAMSRLHRVYGQAHLSKSPTTMAAEWDVRWLPAFLSIIKDSIPGKESQTGRGCGPGQHLVNKHDLREDSAGRTAREELAGREHWQDALQQAMSSDLAWRHARASE